MKRDDFIEDINDFYDLLEFCRDNECYECDDIYDEDCMSDYVNEQIETWISQMSWTELRDKLDAIDTSYSYFILDEYGDFQGADDNDFQIYKDMVLDWADNQDLWEDEDDEEDFDEYEEYSDCEGETEAADDEEPITIPELLASCVGIKFVREEKPKKNTTEDDLPSSDYPGFDLLF